jgi:hypothetical protein
MRFGENILWNGMIGVTKEWTQERHDTQLWNYSYSVHVRRSWLLLLFE